MFVLLVLLVLLVNLVERGCARPIQLVAGSAGLGSCYLIDATTSATLACNSEESGAAPADAAASV